MRGLPFKLSRGFIWIVKKKRKIVFLFFVDGKYLEWLNLLPLAFVLERMTSQKRKKKRRLGALKLLKPLFTVFKPLVSCRFFQNVSHLQKKKKAPERVSASKLFFTVQNTGLCCFSKGFSSVPKTKTGSNVQAKFRENLFIVVLFQKTRRKNLCLVSVNKKQRKMLKKKSKSVYFTIAVENKELNKELKKNEFC